MMSQMKPCPFCGRSETRTYRKTLGHDLLHAIACYCGAEVSEYSHASAVKSWNTRDKDYDALAAQLKTETLRADAAVGDANEAESAGKAVSLLLAERITQRDEGLAREAELHQLLADLRDYIRPNSVLNPEGVAVKLKTRIDQVLLSLPIFEMVQRTECCAEAAWLLFDRNFYDQYGLLVMTSAEIIQRATSYAGYTGCADGEKAE